MATKIPDGVVKSVYTSNWGDHLGYPAARFLLPLAIKIPLLTPNVISILAFTLYLAGCVLIALDYSTYRYAAAILLPLGFILDDLDGQVARTRKLASPIGNYLDKVLDVLKIYLLTAALGYATYQSTGDILYIFLAFTACFFFNYRYYIKLETVLSQTARNPEYLTQSAVAEKQLLADLAARDQQLSQTFLGRLKLLWLKHRMLFYVDEAEFALFTSLALLFNKLEWVVWILAISQVLNAFVRVIQRGYQTQHKREQLLLPVRK